MHAIVNYYGPVYLRLSKFAVASVNDSLSVLNFKIGKGVVLKKGTDLILFATGNMVCVALDVAKLLRQSGLEVGVVNIHTLKPLDENLILKLADKTRLIICLEEHSIIGGLGDSVCGVVCTSGFANGLIVKKIGLNDEFGQSGDEVALLQHYKLDVLGVLKKVKVLVKQVLNLEV